MFEYNKKLIVLVGNIGSGKTTASTKFVKQGYACISRDALRYMIGNGLYVFDFMTERMIAKGNLLLVEEFMKMGINIIVDEVNVNKVIRKRYIRLAKKYKYHSTAYILPRYSKRTCVNRRMKNPHGLNDRMLWEDVWNMFDKNYIEPTKKEGFKEIAYA